MSLIAYRLGYGKYGIIDPDSPEGMIRTQGITTKRILWDTDVDFNKGSFSASAIEIDGTGPASVVTPKLNTVTGNIPYTSIGDYTLSDSGKLDISGGKAILKATVTPNGDWPFSTASDYTYDSSKILVSGGVSQLWGTFDASLIVPINTTVVIKCRISNNMSNMGSYGNALNVGDIINLTGQFIQFSIDFTGTLSARALVDYVAAVYQTNIIQDVIP